MSVKVAIRVRPFNQRQKFLGCICCVQMKQNTTIVYQNKQKNKKQHYFTFDYSLWSHDEFQLKENGYMKPVSSKYIDQIKVYNLIGTEILANALQGYNCCLFAYGQTGSGKSYSMIGYGTNRGIVPMVCQQIFSKIKKSQVKGQKEYQITFSMLQIYNEKVQDLFTPTNKRPQNGLKVRQNKTLGVYVEGLTKIQVYSYADIQKRMDDGSKNKSLASTLMNEYSSRAHTIIMIEFIQKEWINKLKMNKKSSFINLVDLAGSERVAKTGIQDNKDRLKEASNINKSLHTLGRVIQTLAELSSGKTKALQVPYRDSSLTRILENALGGNSKTIMICAISPANDNYQETLSTLRYADQTKKIKNKPVINQSAVDKIIRELRQQNDRLKKMLEAPEENSIYNSRQLKTDTQKKQIKSNLRASMREVQKQIRKNLKSFAINTDEVEEQDYQSLMMTQFIDLEEPSQFFSELSFDLGNKAQVYITNLNQDELLNYKIRYSCEKDLFITNKNTKTVKFLEDYAKIVLCGLGIQQNHAKIIRKNDKYYIQALSETASEYTLLNGKPVTQRRQLFHRDRIILGINSVFIFKNNLKKGQQKQTPLDYEFAINERQQQMQNLSLISPTSLNLFLSNNFLKSSPMKQIYTPSTAQYASTKKLFQEQNEKQIMSKLQQIQIQFSKLVKQNQQKLKEKEQFYKSKLNDLKKQKEKENNRKMQLQQKLMIKSIQTQTLKNKNGELQKLKLKLSKYNEQKDKRKKYRESFLLDNDDNRIQEDLIGQFVDLEDPKVKKPMNIDTGTDHYEINIKKKKKIQINNNRQFNRYQDIIVEEVDDVDSILQQSFNEYKGSNRDSIMNDSLLLGDEQQHQKEKKQKKKKIQALRKKLTQQSDQIQRQAKKKQQKSRNQIANNINFQFKRLYNIKIRCEIEIDVICAKCSQYMPTNEILLLNKEKQAYNFQNRYLPNETDAQLEQFYFKNDKKRYLSSEDLKILQDQIIQLQARLIVKHQENLLIPTNSKHNESLLLNSSGDNDSNLMVNILDQNNKARKLSYESRRYSESFVDFNISQDKIKQKESLQLSVNEFIQILQKMPQLSASHQIQYKLDPIVKPKPNFIQSLELQYKVLPVIYQIIDKQILNPFSMTLKSEDQFQKDDLLLIQQENKDEVKQSADQQDKIQSKQIKIYDKSQRYSISQQYQLNNLQQMSQFIVNLQQIVQKVDIQTVKKQCKQIGIETEHIIDQNNQDMSKKSLINSQSPLNEQVMIKQLQKHPAQAQKTLQEGKQFKDFAIITDINMQTMPKYAEQYENHEEIQYIQRYINKPQNNQTLNSTINQSLSSTFNQINQKLTLDLQNISTNTNLIQVEHRAINTSDIIEQKQDENGSSHQEKEIQQQVEQNITQREDENVQMKINQIVSVQKMPENPQQNQETNTQIHLQQQTDVENLEKQYLYNRIKELQHILLEKQKNMAQKQEIAINTSIDSHEILRQASKIKDVMKDIGSNTSFEQNVQKLVQFGINTSLELSKLIDRQLNELQLIKSKTQQIRVKGINKAKNIQKSDIQYEEDQLQAEKSESSDQIQQYLIKKEINNKNRSTIYQQIIINNQAEDLYSKILNEIKRNRIKSLSINHSVDIKVLQNDRVKEKLEDEIKQENISPIHLFPCEKQHSQNNSQDIVSDPSMIKQGISSFKVSKLSLFNEQIQYIIASSKEIQDDQMKESSKKIMNQSIGIQYDLQMPQQPIALEMQKQSIQVDISLEQKQEKQIEKIEQTQKNQPFRKSSLKSSKSLQNSYVNKSENSFNHHNSHQNSHNEQQKLAIEQKIKKQKTTLMNEQSFADKFNLSFSQIQKHELSYQQSAFGLDGLLKEEELNHKIKLLQDKIKQLQSQNKIEEAPIQEEKAQHEVIKEDSHQNSLQELERIEYQIFSPKEEKQQIINSTKYVHLTKKKKKKKKQQLTEEQRKELQIERQIQGKIIQCNNENLINERNLQIHKRKRQAEELRKVVLKKQKVQLQKQLLTLIPMIRRFNLIARQMKRLIEGKISIQYRNFSHFQMIQVLKNYRVNRKNSVSNLQIKIVILNCEEGRLYTWSSDTFKNRYEIAEQSFQKYLENEDSQSSRGKNLQDVNERAKDPFWDPVDFISQGIGYLSMQSLLFSLSYQGYVSLIYKSNIVAKIYVTISPIKIKKHEDDDQNNEQSYSQLEHVQISNQRNLLQKDIYFTLSIQSIKFMTSNEKQKLEESTSTVNITALNSNIVKYTISYELLEDDYKLIKYTTPETDFNEQKQFKRIDYMRRHSFRNISETTLAYISDCPIKFNINVMKDYNQECLNASFNNEEQYTEDGMSQLDKSYGSIDDKSSSIRSIQKDSKDLKPAKSDFSKKNIAVIYQNTEIVAKIESQAKKQQEKMDKIRRIQKNRSKNRGGKGQKDKQCTIY